MRVASRLCVGWQLLLGVGGALAADLRVIQAGVVWPSDIDAEVLAGGGIGRAIEEALAVDGTALLELLAHLIGSHLLAEAHLTQLDGTRAVLILMAGDSVLTTLVRKHTRCMVIIVVQRQDHLRIFVVDHAPVVHEPVLVLTLQSAPHMLGFARVLFRPRLRQLLHLSLGLLASGGP